MKTIQLTRNKLALVDDDDFPKLDLLKWQVHWDGVNWYAVHSYTKNAVSGKIRMHRLILNALPGHVVDHINGNALDNRKTNLRICSQRENSVNSRKAKGRSSRFKGVSWFRPGEKWRARITINGRLTALGYFHNESAAALAYDRRAKTEFGEFARVNFAELTNMRGAFGGKQ